VKVAAVTETTHNPFEESHTGELLAGKPPEQFLWGGAGNGPGSISAPRQSLTRQTWHKVLKSGCTVEDCRLETAERLKRHLALFSIIAVRLMYVTYLARVQPDVPATGVFSNEEIEALHIRVHKTQPPPQPATLREVVRMIGRLGGHLGRKGDGEPGVTVLWRGWASMYETIEALRAYKQSQGLTHSS
jgi:hypothetical protein